MKTLPKDSTNEHHAQHLVALGANLPSALGGPLATLEAAITRIAAAGLIVIARSAWYRTPAVPAGAGPDFINGAIALEGEIDPDQLLVILHEIETSVGRTRNERWVPRSCDLDLIASGTHVMPSETVWRHWANLSPHAQMSDAPDQLILPHPRLQDRGFVLRPLADIASGWRHPVLGRTIGEMLEDLPADSLQGIRKIQ